jgi:hypothetical protein
VDLFIRGDVNEYEHKGDDIVLPVPDIPAEQVACLRTHRPHDPSPHPEGLPQSWRGASTATVTTNFVAGAIGSGAAGLLWPAAGWAAVTGAGLVCCVSYRPAARHQQVGGDWHDAFHRKTAPPCW